jgi:nitroreductase
MKIPNQASGASTSQHDGGAAAPHDMAAIKLPAPRTEGGKPLMEALRLRRSIREFAPQALSADVLSDLLWAAFGINRPDTGERTVPYWHHVIVIELYVAMENGVWIYDAKSHSLLPHLSTDIRAQTGLQDFVSTAPLNLIYVGRGEEMKDVPMWQRHLYASVDAGFMGQNVYLLCASAGLATVFHQTLRPSQLWRTLRLSSEQFVVFVQTVGYQA